MKLNVRFSENDKNLSVKVTEENHEFNPDMGEVMVLHDGQNGATFTPSVSSEGVISWTNDRNLPNPEPVNIKGKDGVDGRDGRDGINGKDGYTPVKGVDYFDGQNGKPGKDGYTPVKGVDYFDGQNGQPGKDGVDGRDGVDGKTPVRGTDYYTEADKAEMVSAVLAALPVYGGEVVAV